MDTIQNKITVLMLPWLAHGHISPFLDLAKKLTQRNFYIYFCSTPIILTSIKKKLDDEYSPSLELIEFHLPSSPELPPHYHTTNGLPTHLMTALKNALDMASPGFSDILKTLNPDLVIYDHNQPWAPSIASSQNIPAVQFLTSGATMASFSFHMFKNPGKAYPFPKIYFSGFKTLMSRDMAESSVDELRKDKFRVLEALKQSCNIVLIKSFRELEGKYLDYFSILAEKKMVPVGHLVDQAPIDKDEDIGIIQWLDKKDKSSTVFVSFGSELFLTKEKIEELAHGLELSQVNFIWVVRFPVGEKIKAEEALPAGFLERVGERGMIVEGWAPIIAMPMQLDQPLNARLVEEVGVGLEVKRDENERHCGKEIAQVIRRVVVEKDGKDIRIKAREFSENMMRKGEEEIDGVVEELIRLFKE